MRAGDASAARRYADAVFEIAEAERRLDEWEQELALLAGAFGDPDVVSWLMNPSVPAGDKDSLIQTGLASATEEARNLGRILVTRGRAALAPAILDAFRSRLDRARGIVHASVTTAVQLSDEELATVNRRLAYLTQREVKMESAVDPSIIGGIVVRMGDKLLDGSTRARLIDLKRRLAGSGS